MAAPPTPARQPLDTKDLLAVLQELGAALRARSDAEHAYTAAAVGSFGAVAWGVAALKPQDGPSPTVAAAGVLFVTCCVVWKITWDHHRFAETKQQYGLVAERLREFPNGDIIPKRWTDPAGKGAWISVSIVLAAAGAAIAFCLTVGGWPRIPVLVVLLGTAAAIAFCICKFLVRRLPSKTPS